MSGAFEVGPTRRMAAWQDFFHGSPWRAEDFHALVAADGPGRALFTVETMIDSLHRSAQEARLADHPRLQEIVDEVRTKSTWLAARSREARRALGPLQRELDLGVLRWIRRSACLALVIGAGATMAAGGPSWPALVRHLLIRVLERGHPVTAWRETAHATPALPAARAEVVAVERLAASDEDLARRIVAAIDAGRADVELLTQGAQLCHDLRGQHLFTDITGALYAGDRPPGPIHEALAELAEGSGWAAIVSYNFDDLMGEALDARGLPRIAHVAQRRGRAIAGYSNEHRHAAGPQAPALEIFHLHGYTRRRPHPITDIQFVFSAAQYRRAYARRKRRGLIDHVFDHWLARPVQHALYVGCSFVDPAMNGLLADAAARLPGRCHYAILQWPGAGRFAQAPAEAIEAASERFETIGVRPLWYDHHDEIPTLLRRLA